SVAGSTASSNHAGSCGWKKLTTLARRPPTVVEPRDLAFSHRAPHSLPGSSSGVRVERTNGPLPWASQRLPPITTARDPADVTYVRRSGATMRNVVVSL